MTDLFPTDKWYPVGGSAGLLPGMARAVSLCGRDIACWRGQSGRVHAWDNRCIHRGMRLSFGFVRGDRLVCRYHGWNYDEGGACCYVPAQPATKPSSKVTVPRHGAIDRDGLLWVRLDGAEGEPPSLSAEGDFAFVQSIVLPRSAEELAEPLRRVVFSSGEGETVRYQRSEPQTGVIAITAEAPSVAPETRLLALQPQEETRSTLHIMVAGGDDDPKLLRRAAALWGRRLAWFLENDGEDSASYNPWMPETVAP